MSDSWEEDDDGLDSVPCPYCRKPIPEDTPRCPYCENYISGEEVTARKPTWVIVGASFALLAALSWVVGWGNIIDFIFR